MVRASKFNSLFLSISVLALAACGASHGVEPNKTAAPTPPVMEKTTNLNMASKASATNNAIDETTDPVIVPINANLPQTQTLTQEDRLAHLEQAVASLRNDYATIMPAFAQLNVTNTRVQALLDQIEADRGGSPVRDASAPATTTTVTKVTSSSDEPITTVETETIKTTTANVPSVAPATVPSAVGNKVQAVRLGEHPGKTRIVIDLAGSDKIVPAYDIDNTEKLLVIDLPGVSAQGVASSLPKASGIVAGMTTSETANGSNLVVQLKKDAKILLKEYVKAANGQLAKLVLDIGPAV